MITAVTVCKGRRDHLEITLPAMLEEFDRVIVVDWECPQFAGKWAAEQGAAVIWGKGQWNLAKARNLGSKAVNTDYVCFLDADTILMPGFIETVKSMLEPKAMVIAPRDFKNHDVLNLGGFVCCHMPDFRSIGGYDETFIGFAHEDADLRVRLCLDAGVKAKRPTEGIATIRHTDQMRVQFYDEPLEVSSYRNFHLVKDKLAARGVTDWVNDPRTADIAYRIAGYHD